MAPPPPPPPPSRTADSKAAATTDLADEFEDINFFPGTSPMLKPPRLVKKVVANSLSNSSASVTSGNSSGSLADYSDDFTLGSRTSNPSGQINTAAPAAPAAPRIHSHHHNHGGHKHQSQRGSHPNTNTNINNNLRSKERFVFSNFRFLVKKTFPFPNSVDEPFDWLSIEMVLVPEIENVLCPICLDVPCIPRFTRCGHIYCLPCLLQFFQTSEPSGGGLGNNWRSCPVCAEPLHLKQLRPVKFCPATEPQEGEIFHSLLIQKAVGSLRPHLPVFTNDSLSTLSPFQRLIPVSRSFVLNEIIAPDINLLRSEIKSRKSFGEESLELSFFEASIKLLEDQRKHEDIAISSVKQHQHHEPAAKKAAMSECFYFHQSRDGLNVFLHPLSMKILKHHFNSYDAIPRDLSLPIIQLERVLVNSSNRKRFRYLDHLSLGTQIILVEVDLRSIVSDSTLQTHSKELSNRQDARDQEIAKSSASPSTRDRSILEEWKMMEDDYYSITQASAAMDIRVPESVKLDNLDDEASFPLPSSFNNSSSPAAIPIKSNPKKSSSVGSPSFSALAHSLNSPFTFSSSINFSNEALMNNGSPPPASSNANTAINTFSISPTRTPSWVSPPTQTSTPTTTSATNSKKKIVLFSSGLNLKQR